MSVQERPTLDPRTHVRRQASVVPGWRPAIVSEPGSTRFDVDGGELEEAIDGLCAHTRRAAVVAIRRSPAGLELTVAHPDEACWRTAVVATQGPGSGAAAVRLGPLADVLGSVGAGTVQLRLADGGLTCGGRQLAPADPGPAAPRPPAGGLVRERVELPAALPDGVPIRLPGLALIVPPHLSQRLHAAGISVVALFERDGGWFLSGVAQGRPLVAIVGAVAVY